MDDDEYDEVTIPSFRFRWIDGLVLLVNFVDDIAASIQVFTANLLNCVSAHANHTLDREQAQQALDFGVEII